MPFENNGRRFSNLGNAFTLKSMQEQSAILRDRDSAWNAQLCACMPVEGCL